MWSSLWYMSRRTSLLAIGAALLCAALAGYYLFVAPTAGPTTSLFEFSDPPLSAPQQAGSAVSASRVVPPTLAAVASGETPPPPPSTAELQAAHMELRATLVNIICTAPPGSGVHSISASGSIVTGTGYVITNAHVAQYFLLPRKGVSCKLRTGNPAQVAYEAQVAYLPARWVGDNMGVLVDPAPHGTGERDFAILAITGSATKTPLPPQFPYISLASLPPVAKTWVVIGTYGAEMLSLTQIVSALSPTIAVSAVKSLFTFGTSTVDVLTFGGSVAAQEGSSGGSVLGLGGTLLGVVTTSGAIGTSADRSLSALSAPYIRREYQAQTGESLDMLLSRAPTEALASFAPQARALEALILTTLPPAH